MDKHIRPIRIEGDVAFVPLTQGYEAKIDAADAHLVSGSNWRAMIDRRADGTIRNVYAFRATKTIKNGRRKDISMHRLIAETPDGMVTDHEDGNGLNNRRANLRNATNAQNQYNSRKPTHNSSGVKGVSWCKRGKRWTAGIKHCGKDIHLGYFPSIEDAAAAYAAASAQFHGDFGRTA